MSRPEHPTLEMPAPGGRVDRFTLERSCGAGGGGLVFLARDADGSRVALKVLPSREPLLRARFEREALALQRIAHPAIVRYVDHGIDRDLPWLAMEWIDGHDLRERLAKGPLGVEETLALGVRLADALVAAHEAGVLHRDLKPANVMLPGGRLDRARLVDFGVARDETATDLSLTHTGMVVGTPSYMSPEQATADREIDGRADLFALGSLLWQCLTGRVAFEGSDAIVVFAQLLTVDPPPASSLAPGVPAHLDRLLAQLLKKDREQRPPDALAVRAALELLRPTTEPPAETPRTSRRVRFAAPPALVWAIFSDTDRWNRLVGSGLATYTHDDASVARVGHGAVAGIPVAWRELGEWVEGHFGWGERRYDDGPLVASVLHFECTPTDDGGTELFVETWPTASPTAPPAAAAMLAQHFDKRLARYVDAVRSFLDEHTKVHGPFALDPEVPAVIEAARVLTHASDRALVGSTRATDEAQLRARAEALPPSPHRDAFVQLLHRAPDDALRVLRSIELASALDAPVDEATRLLVDGTHAGLLDLRFELVCPTCRVAAQVVDDVLAIGARARCGECRRDFELDLDANVDVIFTVHEAVRDVPPELWCAGAPRWRPHVLAQLRPAPGLTRELPIALPRSPVVARLAGHEACAPIVARGLAITIGAEPDGPTLAVEPLDEPVLRVVHTGDRRVPDLQIERASLAVRALTMRDALAVPALASLLGGDARATLGRATLAVLYVSLDGLEALCTSEGDARALELVGGALDRADRLVREAAGAVVERSVDALLACFAREEDAERARAAIEDADEGASLRMGVASGPVLLVREADGVALFGATVVRARHG
jgi:uncharacterized protein YndB with AHSA1/START domain